MKVKGNLLTLISGLNAFIVSAPGIIALDWPTYAAHMVA